MGEQVRPGQVAARLERELRRARAGGVVRGQARRGGLERFGGGLELRALEICLRPGDERMRPDSHPGRHAQTGHPDPLRFTSPLLRARRLPGDAPLTARHSGL